MKPQVRLLMLDQKLGTKRVPIQLADGAIAIEFTIDNDRVIRVSLGELSEELGLEIRTPEGWLVVHPRVANVVCVDVEQYGDK